LKPTTVLQRVDDLVVSVGLHGRVTVSVEDRVVDAGSRGLAVIDCFADPCTVQDAVGKLGARGERAWINLTGVITRLWRGGVLTEPGGVRPAPGAADFGSAPVHIAMLNDRARTDAYLKAIRRVVRPDDVVVEIGTGSGVLAVAAAQAGARRVYAIEVNRRMAEIAREVVHANGVADRVEVLIGWSSEVDVPERGTVLISETLGNAIFNEGIIETFRDAALRLLQPSARRIPASIDVVATPVSLPMSEMRRAMAAGRDVDNWREWYDIDLSALMLLTPNPSRPLVSRLPTVSRSWVQLAPPQVLATVPTDGSVTTAVTGSAALRADAAGQLNGIMICFDAELADGIRLGNVPDRCDDGCHWQTPVWPVWPPFRVAAGDGLWVELVRGAAGFQVQAHRQGEATSDADPQAQSGTGRRDRDTSR
jgi:protein arginine N-methyltransferase 1